MIYLSVERVCEELSGWLAEDSTVFMIRMNCQSDRKITLPGWQQSRAKVIFMAVRLITMFGENDMPVCWENSPA